MPADAVPPTGAMFVQSREKRGRVTRGINMDPKNTTFLVMLNIHMNGKWFSAHSVVQCGVSEV